MRGAVHAIDVLYTIKLKNGYNYKFTKCRKLKILHIDDKEILSAEINSVTDKGKPGGYKNVLVSELSIAPDSMPFNEFRTMCLEGSQVKPHKKRKV